MVETESSEQRRRAPGIQRIRECPSSESSDMRRQLEDRPRQQFAATRDCWTRHYSDCGRFGYEVRIDNRRQYHEDSYDPDGSRLCPKSWTRRNRHSDFDQLPNGYVYVSSSCTYVSGGHVHKSSEDKSEQEPKADPVIVEIGGGRLTKSPPPIFSP